MNCVVKFCFSLLLVYIVVLPVESNDNAWRKTAFNYVYNRHVWDCEESVSGPGSSFATTATLRIFLPAIIKALDVITLLDAGCGDLNWIKNIPLDIDSYIGIDIVDELIESNKKTYTADWVHFESLDLTIDTLPKVDLILCRDCLQHLSYADIKATINNFKHSKSTYLLATNYFNLHENKKDIKSGYFHVVNLMNEPFNFPEPLIFFDELSAEEDMRIWRKRMCVWRLEDLPIYVTE